MRVITFAKRTLKEILRDPMTLTLGIGFPTILLLLLNIIQKSIPVSIFEIESLAPGMSVFGLSFMSLFSAMLISKDRESAFLQRLYATPMKAIDFILGYTIPIIPIALAQSIICYTVAIMLGLPVTITILYSILFNLIIALFFIGLGLLFGSILNTKGVNGICGPLLTNLTVWLSGMVFDIELIGGALKTIANMLPFIHAVEIEKAILLGNYADVFPHIYWILGYTVFAFVIAIVFFLRQMRKE